MNEMLGKAAKPWSTRPNFKPRQKLSAHQLNRALDDQLARAALLNRALHGSGVVFGLGIELTASCTPLQVACGLALDRYGRTLYWTGGPVALADLVGRPPTQPGSYTLRIHFAERRETSGGCGPCAEEADWVEQGVVFSLRADCEPASQACPDLPEGACITRSDYICQRTGGTTGQVPPAPDLAWACATPPKLCEIECDWSYDPGAGIAIAYVEVRDCRPEGADCPPKLGFTAAAACEVRPFVYRSPLLKELIEGCDSDHGQVESLSWQDWLLGEWTNEIAWETVAALFEESSEGFRVRFTRPIRTSTLHPGSVFLTVYTWRNSTDYWAPQIIPAAITPVAPDGDFTREIKFVIYPEWINAEIKSHRSTLFYGANFELTIRGQMLRDSCGDMLDARLVGVSPEGRGQARPGGDLVAMFRSAPREGLRVTPSVAETATAPADSGGKPTETNP
jgi:hypothetical protein